MRVKKEKDWINRDDDFVHRGKIRSGWDDTTKSSTEYIMKGSLQPPTKEAEFREIHKLCSNRANILLPESTGVALIFDPAEKTGKTDGKRVIVSTGILDDKTKTFAEKSDIMMGITTHEMAHINHSNFSYLKKTKDRFHQSILNIIEDERIENILTEEYPGYANSIASVKKYFFDEKYDIAEAIEKKKIGMAKMSEEEIAAMELYDMFFRFVRYPDKIDEDVYSRHEIALDDIREVLTPYPMTAKGAFDASTEIYEIISKAIKKEMEDKSDEEGEEEDEGGEGSGSRGSGKGKSDDESEDKKSSKEKEESEEEEEEEEKESDEDDKESEDEDEEEGEDEGESKHESKRSAEEKATDIKEAIADMMEVFKSDNAPDASPELSKAACVIKYHEEFIHDERWKATFRKGVPNEWRYKTLAEKVIGDSRRLASNLFTRVFNEVKFLKGMRSGSLDDGKIVEAAHGVKTVHLQRIEKETRKLNIVMLIDESGSMGPINSDKTDAAASAAILIEKAFETFPVGQLFVYGFTSDATYGSQHDFNQIIRYREPGLNVRFGIGDVRGRANNRDGHAIRAVAYRVRQFTNEPCIFFVISDGQPAASDYGGYHDTKMAVQEVSRMKFFPIQIGIGGGLRESQQAEMFTDFVHYDTPTQMVSDLRKLIIRKAHHIFGL